VAPGTTVIVASAPGTGGTVLDSALIAVPPSGHAVAFAAADFSSFATSRVGDTVDVVVGVYLGAVSGEKLGSYAAQLDWSPGVLQYLSTAAVPLAGFAAPVTDATNAGSGHLLFSASDAAGTAGPAIGLAHVRFIATSIGTSAVSFGLTDLTAATTSTNLLPGAMVFSAQVQVK
jgi:hypothetical protein